MSLPYFLILPFLYSDHADTIAATDLNSAFSRKNAGGSDEAVAMFLKERGYLRVDNFNVAHPDSEVPAAWMENDGLHVMAPGPLPTPEQLDAASAVYQGNLRNSPVPLFQQYDRLTNGT